VLIILLTNWQKTFNHSNSTHWHIFFIVKLNLFRQERRMKINLVYGNHWNFGIGVGDTFRYLSLAISQAGYDVITSREPVINRINIYLENFDTDYVAKLKQLKHAGGQYIIIATEFLTGDTFNDFEKTLDISYYSDREYWKKRYQAFSALVNDATAIWHFSDLAATDYEKQLDRTVGYVPHHYVKNFATVQHRSDAQKDIDFLFTGSITNYRKKILQGLSNLNFKIEISSSLTAPFHRDDLIARSKFCLNIPQFKQWPYPSQSRYFYHLINRSPIITPTLPYKSDLEEYTLESTVSILEYCQALYEQANYTQLANNTFHQFKRDTNASIALASLLKKVKL